MRQGGHTVSQYARDVHEVLEVLDVRNATAIGWSMGSLVAWDYVLQHRDNSRITGVVVVSQGPSDFTQPDWPYGIADAQGLAGFHQAVQADSAGFLGGFIPLLFADELAPADAERLHASIRTIAPNTASAILVDQTLRDYRDAIPGIATPHLLVWGTDEKVIAVESGRWLHEKDIARCGSSPMRLPPPSETGWKGIEVAPALCWHLSSADAITRVIENGEHPPLRTTHQADDW